MPFIQRFVSPIYLSSSSSPKSDRPTDDAVDQTVQNNHDSIQNSFVNLLRQIADLAKHSENIIMQIFNDSLNVAERWQSLERRLDAIKTHVDRLDANAIEITSAGNVARFIEVEKHYSSTSTSSTNKEHDTETNRLFVVDTRPRHLKDLCQSIRTSSTYKKRRSVLVVDFEDGSTQTDDDNVYRRRSSTRVNGGVLEEDNTKLVSTSSQVDSKHSSSTSESFLSTDESHFSVDHRRRRPTSTTVVDVLSPSTNNNFKKSNVKKGLMLNSLSSTTTTTTGVTTIEIDTSGSAAVKRMSALRKSRNKICAPSDVERSPIENVSSSKTTTCDDNLLLSKRVNGERIFSQDYCGPTTKPTNNATVDGAPRKIRRCSRRNTIANVVDLKNNFVGVRPTVDDDKRSRNKPLTTSTTINSPQFIDQEDEFDSNTPTTMADEYFYDFAPFYRRRTKRSILSSVNQFFSLRRPSKKNNVEKGKITSSATLDDFRKSTIDAAYLNSPLIIPSHRRQLQQKPETTPSQNGLKQFFKRTLSLHLSSTRKTKKSSSPNDNDYLYESLPFRRSTNIDSPKNGYCNSSDIIGDLRKTDSKSMASSNNFSRNYTSGRPKTNLPITMESQVLNVATVLRNRRPSSSKNVTTSTTKQIQKTSSSPSSSRDSAYSSCGKKIRPMSIVSFGSIASLDLNDKNLHNSWYRQGYQLEYPDECSNLVDVKTPPTVEPSMKISSPRLIVSTVPSDILFGRKTSSSRSPYSDISSVNDSNYSCDQEGYYTSMHRDSGLFHNHLDTVNGGVVNPLMMKKPQKMNVGLKDFRGRSFSTHSSSSTVAGEPDGVGDCRELLLPNRSPVGSDIVVDSSNESTSSTSILIKEKIVDVSARHAFPPLCDISLSESSDNETLRKNRRRYHEPSTSPSPTTTSSVNHMSAETCARIDAFDRWLLSKFEAEMTLKHKSTTNGWGHSLPRRRKEPNNNEITHADACIVDHIESSMSNYNHTVPRKSVRFLD